MYETKEQIIEELEAMLDEAGDYDGLESMVSLLIWDLQESLDIALPKRAGLVGSIKGKTVEILIMDEVKMFATEMNPFAPFMMNTVPASCAANVPMKKCCNKEEGKIPMKTETETQRDYLAYRLNDVFYKLEDDLYTQFHLRVNPPKNFEEAVERIKAGEYTIKDGDKKRGTYGNPFAYMNWRKPGEEEDRAGFDEAMKALYKAKQEANDKVKIVDPKEGLEVLNEFKNWKFSN